MSQAWFEKVGGANKSGQIVPTEQLLNELRRLDCQFRIRGSHINFRHDEAGVRGTIVYGSRKLWSQKTVAEALKTIKEQTGNLFDIAAPDKDSDVSAPDYIKPFNRVAAPSMSIPAQFTSEFHQGDASQVIVRDRDYPQIGTVVTPYNAPEITAQAFKDLEVRRADFAESLKFLEEDGDFNLVQEGEVLYLSHPVFAIDAILSPYDPEETQEPGEILNNCLSDLAPYADNQKILADVLKSRKLELMNEREGDNGVIHQTYVSRRFQRSFGVRVQLETSKSGHLTDKALTGFLDDVDKEFFDSIPHFMKSNYGYLVNFSKREQMVEAKHPMLRELDFVFPNFDNLPKLRDIYAKRDEIGEEAYVDRINDVLKQRDDILELVSYGLIFSVDQMKEASNTFFDMLDEYQKLGISAKKAKAERAEKIAAGEDVPAVEMSDEERHEIDVQRKRTDKKVKKMQSATTGKIRPEYDTAALSGAVNASTMKNQKFPQGFPFGRVMSINVGSYGDQFMANFQYMVLKNHDGSQLVVFSEESMRTVKEMVVEARKNLPEIEPIEFSSDMSIARQHRDSTLSGMVPKIPDLG